jgi:hypothetical protein
MALDAADVRVGGDSHIFLAPIGTAFPVWDTAPAAPWEELGYVTPDGLTLSFNREVTDIFAMQSAEPIRTIATRLPKTVGFTMMQEGRPQLLLALGGGTFTDEVGTPGVVRYEPPEASVVDERALLVEMIDGAYTYRWHYLRTTNREGVEHKYVREDAATFPVIQQILQPGSGAKPFYLLTDDPSFASP